MRVVRHTALLLLGSQSLEWGSKSTFLLAVLLSSYCNYMERTTIKKLLYAWQVRGSRAER